MLCLCAYYVFTARVTVISATRAFIAQQAIGYGVNVTLLLAREGFLLDTINVYLVTYSVNW
jgi:uncharacterized membrane-anchored protein